MPPKRKRADDTETKPSGRATRSSTRAVQSKATTETPKSKTTKRTITKGNKTADAMDVEELSETEAHTEPPAKKPRITAKGKKNTKIDDIPLDKDKIKTSARQNAPLDAKSVKVATTKNELYTSSRSLELFNAYADSDDPDVIGPEGFEKLCEDSSIPLDGALPLILSWQLDAKEMGKITKREWSKGMDILKICTTAQLSLAMTELDNLLIRDLPPLKKISNDKYDRTQYASYAKDTKTAFNKLYMFCFTLAKPEQSRNIDMETSTALWSVILVPKYPLMSEVLEFIEEKKGDYRATNKDLWSMMLEFCQTIKADLRDYEADGAWPTLLDDFVAWKRVKITKTSDGNQIQE